MNLIPIVTGPFQEVCYLAWNAARQALVIDPGCDADLISDALEHNGLEVAAYVCTHGHTDHISALADLHDHHPAPIVMHSRDWDWAFDARNSIEPYYSVPRRPDASADLFMEQQKDWTFGMMHFQGIETPGHTPGSCCLLFPEDDVLISGDTLFKGSCGRTDLTGGDPQQMKASLNKLKQLPDALRVFPGHGPDTTIGIERATNFYMR